MVWLGDLYIYIGNLSPAMPNLKVAFLNSHLSRHVHVNTPVCVCAVHCSHYRQTNESVALCPPSHFAHCTHLSQMHVVRDPVATI